MSIQPFSSDSGFSTTGNITANNIGNVAAIDLNGNTSTVLSGDGTWVAQGGGSGNSISNGTSNVTIPTANSNVVINANTSGWTFDNTGNLTAPGNISAVGNISAPYFIGNGSQLTGVIASAGNTILNGNSNVSISSANGNITMTVGGNTAATFTEDNVFLNNVRNDTSNVTDIVYYNSSTSEITFGPASGGSYGNTQVGVYLSSGTVATDYLTSGNVSATGDVTGNNLYAVNVISATGNVRGGNINTAGGVSAAGNITATGTGTNLVRRAYGIAGSNTAVTLDNIQAMVGGTPIRLYVNTVAGSLTGTGATQTLTSGTSAVSSWTNVPIGAGAGNAFAMSGALTSNGDTAILNLADQNNGTGMWRITGMIANTTANLYGVTIERLV